MATRTHSSEGHNQPPALTLSELKNAGIDLIAFKYPLSSISGNEQNWLTIHNASHQWWGGVHIPGGDGELGFLFPHLIKLKLNRTARTLSVEFNPSRMNDPEGSSLTTVAETQSWSERIIRALSIVYKPAFSIPCGNPYRDSIELTPNWQKEVTVTRLDITRDFYSPFKSFNIAHLVPIKRPYIKHEDVYLENKMHSGISWGGRKKKTYRTTVYDKGLKHHGSVGTGWFRFETQLHWKALSDLKLNILKEVTEKRVTHALVTKWEQGRMSVEVSIPEGSHKVFEALLRESSETKRLTFIGLAWALSNGFQTGLSDFTVREYRKLGASVGFQPGSSLSHLGSKVVRIDFKEGLVVDSWNAPEFTQTVFSPEAILGISPLSEI